MAEKTKNSALTTALAFHYQTLIGLDKCFSLKENQCILFEIDGDVSLFAGNQEDSEQIEVKNYSNNLTDHHENLWNTLKNWLSSEFQHSQYSSLILHTTQAFGVNTRLKEWNEKNANDRLQILQEIFDTRSQDELMSDQPSKIIKLQKIVMDSDKSLLIDVLAKVILFTEALDSESTINEIKLKLIGIPTNNQQIFIENLIGFVYCNATKNTWEIKYEEFKAKFEALTAQFCKREFTFPSFTGEEASEQEIISHQKQLFVKKISEIKHDEMIPEAIGNWVELQNSLLEELDEYPIYRDKTKNYQQKLIRSFKRRYSSAQLDIKDSITSSKRLYNEVIDTVALNMGNDIPPIEYKNGLLHDAMNDNDTNLKWKVEP